MATEIESEDRESAREGVDSRISYKPLVFDFPTFINKLIELEQVDEDSFIYLLSIQKHLINSRHLKLLKRHTPFLFLIMHVFKENLIYFNCTVERRPFAPVLIENPSSLKID